MTVVTDTIYSYLKITGVVLNPITHFPVPALLPICTTHMLIYHSLINLAVTTTIDVYVTHVTLTDMKTRDQRNQNVDVIAPFWSCMYSEGQRIQRIWTDF